VRRLLQSMAVVLLLAGFVRGGDSSFSQLADTTSASADLGLPQINLSGQVINGDGSAIAGATVRAGDAQTTSDHQGGFHFSLRTGDYQLQISAKGYAPMTLPLSLKSDTELKLQLGPSSTTDVMAKADPLASDPSTRIYDTNQLLAAHPGLPGLPVSVPGFPSETASGGVKAPQYFAPGVAGDHGEPIAQYIQIGDFLFPNNLPANAHGNGYADPNLLIPAAIGGVETDAGAFDVRHGNNAVNLAVAYGLRPRLEPFLTVGGDLHNYDLVGGWSPANPQTAAWLGLEIAGGNGFLALPENRKQYKLNAERSFTVGRHQLTLFGAGYDGYSRIPGLTPIGVRIPGDTIDPRQSDRTYTFLFVASDTWQLSDMRQVQFSGFFRTYSLSLKSNFGDGLIRQSESRTVAGGNASYTQRISNRISFSAGLDLRQDAPRNVELARADSNGVFQPLTLNTFTISDVAPYASVDGTFSSFLSYNLGVRRDEILFNNTDQLTPGNSYHEDSGLTSPRGTVAFHFPDKPNLPVLAFSYGKAFHTNDPRIGLGTSLATPLATSRAYQFVATEVVAHTQLRLVLSRVSNSQELAKIDPDTGLQQDVGPSLVRAVTISAQHQFSFGSIQATFARARATDRLTGEDVPEAPRLIWDVSGTVLRLPWGMRASGELEYVGAKPLGDGFTAVPVREVRGALTRNFRGGLFDTGVYFLFASGYTGQTLETLQLAGEAAPLEQIVGVRTASYAGVTFTYHFNRQLR
jgi:Carboxypeptidase regulatory-like domain